MHVPGQRSNRFVGAHAHHSGVSGEATSFLEGRSVARADRATGQKRRVAGPPDRAILGRCSDTRSSRGADALVSPRTCWRCSDARPITARRDSRGTRAASQRDGASPRPRCGRFPTAEITRSYRSTAAKVTPHGTRRNKTSLAPPVIAISQPTLPARERPSTLPSPVPLLPYSPAQSPPSVVDRPSFARPAHVPRPEPTDQAAPPRFRMPEACRTPSRGGQSETAWYRVKQIGSGIS